MSGNTLIGTSLFIALSGWATFIYNIVINKPKINGQIFNVIIGQMPNPENNNEMLTSFITYLYLTNQRKNSVHILDYEMEVDYGNGFEKLLRVYGTQDVLNWDFQSQTLLVNIPDFNQKLIYNRNKPLEYGIPLHGFILFVSKKPQTTFLNVKQQNRYRVSIIDAFQGKHKIISSEKGFPNLYLLQDLAGIKLRKL